MYTNIYFQIFLITFVLFWLGTSQNHLIDFGDKLHDLWQQPELDSTTDKSSFLNNLGLEECDLNAVSFELNDGDDSSDEVSENSNDCVESNCDRHWVSMTVMALFLAVRYEY